MSLLRRIKKIEKRLKKLEATYPEWINFTEPLAKHFNFTLEDFLVYCKENLQPDLIKETNGNYQLHRSALSQLKNK